MIVYLDWNIFDRVQKIDSLEESEKLIYQSILNSIKDKNIYVPYSNAHISDLMRGYNKNPDYIEGDLNILSELTNNLCIVQYWGNKESTWHYRDVNEFFQSSLNEVNLYYKSFRELIPTIEEHKDLTNSIGDTIEATLRLTPLPDNFKSIYAVDPIFNLIYPKSRIENNCLALADDLLSFSRLINTDDSLYKALKKYVNQTRMRFIKDKGLQKVFKSIGDATTSIPAHLIFDESWEQYIPESKSSKNKAYNKITDEYFKFDMKGYKSDEKFENMIDDSLHTFYGAHCEVFVTRDDKCHYKATEVYKKLKIPTQVMKPDEFVDWFNQNILKREPVS